MAMRLLVKKILDLPLGNSCTDVRNQISLRCTVPRRLCTRSPRLLLQHLDVMLLSSAPQRVIRTELEL
jgi:hypothetical protein